MREFKIKKSTALNINLFLNILMVLTMFIFWKKKVNEYFYLIPITIILIKDIYFSKKHMRKKWSIIDALIFIIFILFLNLYFNSLRKIYIIIAVIVMLIMFIREYMFFSKN